jgi:dihydroorotate dehydrogenase electron transfer subunit
VALACLDGAPLRLLPLVEQALLQRAAITVYAPAIPAGLPEDVEVLPIDLLPEAPAWADFLALDIDQKHLPGLRARLGLTAFQRPACQVQVLVRTAMPCAGLAECGVCAVHTHAGWAPSCADGPVFDFQQLEGG